MSATFILIGILIPIIILFVAIYNNLVRLRQSVAENWSVIDAELKHRHDLIPNLVEILKGYAGDEIGTLEAVINARNVAASTKNSPQTQAQKENILGGALRQLFALSKSYPQLKANENFVQLQKDFSDTENRLSLAKRFYNDNVRELNTSIESFPSSLIANITGFKATQYFEVDDQAARGPVSVKF